MLLDAAETDFLAEVLSKHGGVLSILSSRQASLQIVGSFWQRGDVRGALNAIVQSAGALSLIAQQHSAVQPTKLLCVACCWALHVV